MFKILTKKLNKSGMILNQQGFSLIEVLFAVLLSSIIIAGVIMGIVTMVKTYGVMHKQEVAKDIAAGNMDYIMSQQYANDYLLPPSPAEYSGYQVELVKPVPLELTKQQITINISFNNKIVYSLTDYRTAY